MPSFDPLKLENQLCHAIYSGANALARYYKPLLEPLDLTYPQYLVLLSLWEQDKVNIQAIAATTYFDSGTLTPLLQKLRTKELITVESDPSDLRNRVVRLTKKGEALKRRAAAVPEAVACLFPFKKKELEQLKMMMQSLHQTIVELENTRK